jgi:PsbP-like protein
MKKFFVILAACCFTLLSLAQVKPAPVPKDWKWYTHEAFGCKMAYPPDWELNDQTQGAKFFIFTPIENGDDRFRENFNLQATDISDHPATLKQYVDANLKDLKAAMKNMKTISSKYMKVNGVNTYEILYTGDLDAVDYTLKFLQRYTIIKGKAFVLTYSSEAGKRDKYYAQAVQMLNTFKL